MISYADELRQEGLQQGMQAGEHNAKLEIAKKMLQAGSSATIVAQITSLSLEEIYTLH